MEPSYVDFINHRVKLNPCVSHLSKHMQGVGRAKSRIVSLKCGNSTVSKPTVLNEEEVSTWINIKFSGTRILLVENISKNLICILGKALDIDPVFFTDHIATDFGDFETSPAPPSMANLPSHMCEREYLHLHYQQILDLGDANHFTKAKYALKTLSNTPRNVRRLAPLSGRQLALARACCSLLVKGIGNPVCLVLIDPPVNEVGIEVAGVWQSYPARLLNGGPESFGQPESFSSFREAKSERESTMLATLLHHFQTPVDSPSILQLGYGPIRVVLAEWNMYMSLISRYEKHYEYSLRDISVRSHDEDIVELQRWKRRSRQSLHKLTLLYHFVTHLKRGDDWDLILMDIDFMRQRLQSYGQGLEQTVAMATTMVQLQDSQRSILEAVNVKKLTLIAIIFIPLSWVSSLFSMSDGYAPGQANFWVYFAVAVPFAVLVVILSIIPLPNIDKVLTRKHVKTMP
ncbi:unnamed protein product [Clonostachys rosea]|uniref:Tyrosinase copper-binding domain-containing protein n=1 Tax=Bionectria ochroleuca TaxID=29856 RepID=A0ABY6UN03_BIOOC|nr:unnamed protein product [Clonostachys rosea]